MYSILVHAGVLIAASWTWGPHRDPFHSGNGIYLSVPPASSPLRVVYVVYATTPRTRIKRPHPLRGSVNSGTPHSSTISRGTYLPTYLATYLPTTLIHLTYLCVCMCVCVCACEDYRSCRCTVRTYLCTCRHTYTHVDIRACVCVYRSDGGTRREYINQMPFCRLPAISLRTTAMNE